MNRRELLSAVLVAALAPQSARARGRYRVSDVDVRVSPIVASRIRTDLPGRIARGLRSLRGRADGPSVRVVVELRTIDPYRAGQPNDRRGLAVRYRVVHRSTGRTLAASRFIERSTPREDERGTALYGIRPITQGTTERELADETARQIAREAL